MPCYIIILVSQLHVMVRKTIIVLSSFVAFKHQHEVKTSYCKSKHFFRIINNWSVKMLNES